MLAELLAPVLHAEQETLLQLVEEEEEEEEGEGQGEGQGEEETLAHFTSQRKGEKNHECFIQDSQFC